VRLPVLQIPRGRKKARSCPANGTRRIVPVEIEAVALAAAVVVVVVEEKEEEEEEDDAIIIVMTIAVVATHLLPAAIVVHVGSQHRSHGLFVVHGRKSCRSVSENAVERRTLWHLA
jgi:hypothetical protein